MASKALDDVCLNIPDGQFVGIIGHTGSGKSTLVQHLNGLIRATSGHIYFNGQDIYEKDYDMKKLRSRVGLVFQYPEHQLFEIDVFTDVCFGPKNLGLDKKEVELRAYDALKKVGLPDEFFFQSPFELSGGQKRRVAIAGVLAMQPQVLILDEPTAGLDPRGRDDILHQIKRLQTETGMTILLVSHSMEDVAEYVDRIIVMNRGSVMYDDVPREVFKHYRELEEVGLAAPQVTYIMHALKEKGLELSTDPESCLESYLGYTAKPNEDPDTDWRLDVMAGSTCCVPLINGYLNADNDFMDELHADGAAAGFLCYPLDTLREEESSQKIFDFRDKLEETLAAGDGPESLTLIGGATGLYCGYVDFIAWDIRAVLQKAKEFFEDTDIPWASFHTFCREAGTVTLKNPPEEGADDARTDG